MSAAMRYFNTLPTVALPKGLSNTNTGNLVIDVLPLITMLPCLPTLHLYYKTKRWPDLAVFSLGFALASLYHMCHMHQAGLSESSLLGVSGPVWRTFDILCAQFLLGRTFSHAIGASHWVTHVLANTVFPAVCCYYFWTATEALPMQHIMRTLLAVILASLGAKLILEGTHSLPKYCKKRGARAIGLFVMGFIAFPMPELFPRQYWLFHSLWHCFLAAGYYELYALIEQDSLSMQKKRAAQQKSRKHAVRHAKKQLAVAKMQKADSNSSMDSMSVLASSQSKSGSEGPKVGKNTHGAIAPSEEADSDASAGTDFEESLAFVPGASSVKYYAPMPSAIAQTKPGAAGNGWRWSRRPAT